MSSGTTCGPSHAPARGPLPFRSVGNEWRSSYGLSRSPLQPVWSAGRPVAGSVNIWFPYSASCEWHLRRWDPTFRRIRERSSRHGSSPTPAAAAGGITFTDQPVTNDFALRRRDSVADYAFNPTPTALGKSASLIAVPEGRAGLTACRSANTGSSVPSLGRQDKRIMSFSLVLDPCMFLMTESWVLGPGLKNWVFVKTSLVSHATTELYLILRRKTNFLDFMHISKFSLVHFWYM